VENVVNPPQNPITINESRFDDKGWLLSERPNIKPIRRLPMQFTASVPYGMALEL